MLPLSLYYGYINPIYTGQPGLVWTPEKNIFVLRSVNVQYQNAINQISLIQNQAEQLDKDYNAIDAAIKNKVAIMLPDSIDPIKLRAEVTSIANKSGVAISDLGITYAQNLKNVNVNLNNYQVSFTVKSHYPALKNLITNYEKSERLFVLDSIIIDKFIKNPDDKSFDDGETLLTKVVFNVYYLR